MNNWRNETNNSLDSKSGHQSQAKKFMFAVFLYFLSGFLHGLFKC
nr:hypothetical protein [Mycoplasmopsis bovis]